MSVIMSDTVGDKLVGLPQSKKTKREDKEKNVYDIHHENTVWGRQKDRNCFIKSGNNIQLMWNERLPEYNI